MPDNEKEKEIAPSADPAESEDRKPEPKPAPVLPIKEEIENHETVPAWFKPFADKLDAVHNAVMTPAEPEEPKKEKPEEEEKDDGKKIEKQPKRGKIKLWRSL